MASTWDIELVLMLRHLINDLGTTPKYLDCRLEELILIAGHYVSQEISNFSYTIDIDELTISPDPTQSTRDVAFIDLILLKAVCILDSGEARTRALIGGIKIKDGLSEIDTKGAGKSQLFELAVNSCQFYEDTKWNYQLSSFKDVKSVLSPFTGEDSPATQNNSNRDHIIWR